MSKKDTEKDTVQDGVKKMRAAVKARNNLLYGANEVWKDSGYDSPYTEEVVKEYMGKYHPKGS